MVQASRRKFHYIYKITRNGSNQYYIGMHSTDNLEDGYFGSGKRLWHSINKYGKENHTKEILEFCDSREQLRIREKEIIGDLWKLDEDCMNLRAGGESWDHINNGDQLHKERCSRAAIKRNKELTGTQLAKDIAAKSVETKRERDSFSGWSRSAAEAGVRAAQSSEAREKRKNTFNKIGHQQGEKNSQFGTQWIYNETLNISKKVSKSDLIPDGWKKGRIKKNKN